jgi:pimeloyl-ACP methyl ester carboxylesterase
LKPLCRGDGPGASDRGRTIDGGSQLDRLRDAPQRSDARDGGCRRSAEISAPGAERIRDFSSTPELDSLEGFLERAVKFNPLRNPAVLRRSLHYNLRQTPAGKWAFKHDQRRRSDDAVRSFTEDRTRLASEVAKIKCPTLVVRGALSDVLTDAAAEKFARSLPDGRWVRVKKSGHNVQGDNPHALLDAMLTFFHEAGIS